MHVIYVVHLLVDVKCIIRSSVILYTSPHVTRVRATRRVVHVARVTEMRSVFRMSVGRPEG